jgi:hypothetical protein
MKGASPSFFKKRGRDAVNRLSPYISSLFSAFSVVKYLRRIHFRFCEEMTKRYWPRFWGWYRMPARGSARIPGQLQQVGILASMKILG